MALDTPKATSVTELGEEDGFQVNPGWEAQDDKDGGTRLMISVPTSDLARVHAALLAGLESPLAFLYRRKVNRRDPKPNGAPPDDMLASDVSLSEVKDALSNASDLVYHDARCEVWVRGIMGEQVILDHDGVIYCYPDSPHFRTLLDGASVLQQQVEVMLDRDYVKHWYHASCDDQEDALVRELSLIEVAHQGQA